MTQAGTLVDMQIHHFTFDKPDGEVGDGQSLVWTWELDDGSRLPSECDPKLSHRPENQFRQWAEALLGKPIGVGERVDSRDLIGRRAILDLEVHPKRGWFVSGVAPELGGEG